MGKGSGPYGDITYIFRNLALHSPSNSKSLPYLEIVWKYLCLFATNCVPNTLFEEVSAAWLALLFKQWPIPDGEEATFCPIGAGT
eukprot:5374572-Ditylum_brightwellii.AAC.1